MFTKGHRPCLYKVVKSPANSINGAQEMGYGVSELSERQIILLYNNLLKILGPGESIP